MPHRRCATLRKALTFTQGLLISWQKASGAGVKRGVFYIIGIMGLVFLTALTLPRAGLTEAREAQVNGQIVTFVYSADTARPDDQAFTMAASLNGGLSGAPGAYGPTIRPAARMRIDQSSINAIIYLLRGLHGAILSALLLGMGCGFAERWINRKRRRLHD
jgi:hypothetical protein